MFISYISITFSKNICDKKSMTSGKKVILNTTEFLSLFVLSFGKMKPKLPEVALGLDLNNQIKAGWEEN